MQLLPMLFELNDHHESFTKQRTPTAPDRLQLQWLADDDDVKMTSHPRLLEHPIDHDTVMHGIPDNECATTTHEQVVDDNATIDEDTQTNPANTVSNVAEPISSTDSNGCTMDRMPSQRFMIPPLPLMKSPTFHNHNPKTKTQQSVLHHWHKQRHIHKHPWILPPSPLPMRFHSMSHPLLSPLV
jgi:hypothetical protein